MDWDNDGDMGSGEYWTGTKTRITLKDLFMQEKPQTFIAKGTPNLIKALIEDLKLLGYSTKENEDCTSTYMAIMSDSGHAGEDIGSKDTYSKLYISSTNHKGRDKEITFNLPVDYQKCLDFATNAMNYWIEAEKVPTKSTSTTITIGSRNASVTIQKHGNVIFSAPGDNQGETTIEQIKKLYSEIHSGFNITISNFEINIDSSIRFIKIGCIVENNMFSPNEIKQVIDEYNKLQ